MDEKSYGNRRRTGTPYFSETPLPRNPEFWAKRAKLLDKWTRREADCWQWIGHKSKYGYGLCTFVALGKVTTRGAHRLQWERFNGPPPASQMVRHKCDNRACVNPAHLELGTAADNNADMMARGRHQTSDHYKPLQGVPTPEPPDVLSEWQKIEWRKRYA